MIKKFLSDSIPKFFYEFETEEPFKHCSLCNRELSDSDKYAVEKVLKQNKKINKAEIVYEYAMCWDCASEMGDEISEESKESIVNLYQDHSENVMMKLDYLHRTEKYNIESWLERCTFTGKETRVCGEYSVSGIIEGGKLLYEHSPVVVSDEFMEKMQEVLSEKTKEFLDGLKDELIYSPSEFNDIINSPTVGLF
ncbi:MAG: hypothetical protein KJP21_08590 [Bacteroidia bacterium]|nr:hypothetical protein [Bacteroidia bacterium]NNJ56291.1 hypothetical protein [Bacteroidia bacterium]